MKTSLLILTLIIFKSIIFSQDFSSYENTFKTTIFSEHLKDSVKLEITLPNELKESQNLNNFPVIYLLDSQLKSNYKYNLQTIDYLSSLYNMPQAVIVGISFSRNNRTPWTVPNQSGGKADDLINFITDELNQELKTLYPISNFNLLIGHSRTAIFASYALSKRFDFFNGCIANSPSNFDFGDNVQKKQFETFIEAIDTSTQKYYYYFSVGELAYNDLHEPSVDSLNLYLNSKRLPNSFQWQSFKYKTGHNVTPGLTVARSLNHIFKNYGRRIDQCFKLAANSPQKVPWIEFHKTFQSLSNDFGYTINPTHSFYASLGSDYYNDYKEIYTKNQFNFALEIVLKAIETYPHDYDYHIWAGEMYMTLKDKEKGEHYLNKAITLIDNDKTLSESDKSYLLSEIKNLRK
jgi:predicted alpha/beta superfamily hydrolase